MKLTKVFRVSANPATPASISFLFTYNTISCGKDDNDQSSLKLFAYLYLDHPANCSSAFTSSLSVHISRRQGRGEITVEPFEVIIVRMVRTKRKIAETIVKNCAQYPKL